ncbi:uncharacterized protein LOC117224051 isoform X2 [Megalopta genalis]|uniref:uncharacterized protein LOC117224051 isoform X2 n=1 Tax=Megalopta genalis TaxID=115081 RepID=UPI003FD2DB95
MFILDWLICIPDKSCELDTWQSFTNHKTDIISRRSSILIIITSMEKGRDVTIIDNGIDECAYGDRLLND